MSQRQSQVPALNWHLPVTAAELPSLGTRRSREGPRAPAGDSAGPRQRLLRARPQARRAQEGEVTARFTISWQHAPPQGHSYNTALHQCLPQALSAGQGSQEQRWRGRWDSSCRGDAWQRFVHAKAKENPVCCYIQVTQGITALPTYTRSPLQKEGNVLPWVSE